LLFSGLLMVIRPSPDSTEKRTSAMESPFLGFEI